MAIVMGDITTLNNYLYLSQLYFKPLPNDELFINTTEIFIVVNNYAPFTWLPTDNAMMIPNDYK